MLLQVVLISSLLDRQIDLSALKKKKTPSVVVCLFCCCFFFPSGCIRGLVVNLVPYHH